MKNISPNDRLEREIERHKQRLEDGDKRIIAFYREDQEPPGGYPPLEEPPHRILMRQGMEMIDFAATDLTSGGRVFGTPEYEIEILLYGIGMESLLNGIHLKIDSDEFTRKMINNPGKTPSFHDSIGVVTEDLRSKISKEHYERAVMILNWIRDHRNNEVHLAFHRHRAAYLERLIIEMAIRLFSHYTNMDVSEYDMLMEEIRSLKKQDEHGLSSNIEFDPDGFLE